MIYKSEDIKKINSQLLLNKLYELNNATMLELIEATNLSQSTVRSILIDLENKGILTLQQVDQSSGGRCPKRYTFASEKFNILAVFVDEGTVDLTLKDIFDNQIFHQHITCGLNEELERIIIALTKENVINCISIASSGVIHDDCFYTDQGEYMTKHDIAINLKQKLDIPVIIENDVKSMLMATQSKRNYQNLAYIYMSDTGVGSAYYLHNQLVRGNQSFSGELGLLPYGNQTINEVIASNPSAAVLENIYVQLLITIALTIDPENIIISGKKLKDLSLKRITKKMQTYLSLRYQINIEISNDPLSDGLKGLHYLGILKLFNIYTNYKRGN